ncbi:HutD/Ves family protein [Parapusillimonas granuli]|uniref:HutD family protein n=1 Tax=Parapusillimonas granuli TaxID=380911 RepID=A0A853GAP4_9BURK|nr:HutD family protein [Parapusillimonas granuli]MBB5213351.1 hypothetical protein [Parapusillimonas granuli]NYT51846.1 HutD family protein [Parapusillimonas granuli]
MNWHDFNCAGLPDMPWKNGGGSTKELARWPLDATLDDFVWRASIATIASDGPFSTYENVDRIIALLEGPGVRLSAADAGIDHALDQPLAAYAFPGEAAVHCHTGGAVSRDFNIMVRRGRARARIQGLRQAAAVPLPPHGLALAAAGRWRIEDGGGFSREIGAGHGAWWQGGRPGAVFRLAPQEPGSALLWAAIELQGDDACP